MSEGVEQMAGNSISGVYRIIPTPPVKPPPPAHKERDQERNKRQPEPQDKVDDDDDADDKPLIDEYV